VRRMGRPTDTVSIYQTLLSKTTAHLPGVRSALDDKLVYLTRNCLFVVSARLVPARMRSVFLRTGMLALFGLLPFPML
jgi:hypothetical protein